MEKFLIYLAGHNPQLLQTYLKKSYNTERIRLVQLGITLFVPPLVALYSFSYFVSTITDNALIIIAATISYSLAIFLIDRYFVLSFRRNHGRKAIWPVSWRLILAICVGFTVSEPIILSLFSKSILKEISLDVKNEIANKQDPLNIRKEELSKLINDKEKQREELREKRSAVLSNTESFDSEIASLRQDGDLFTEKRKQGINATVLELANKIKSDKDEQSRLEAEINEKTKKIADEKLGRGLTRETGPGSEVDRLRRGKKDLEKKQQEITEQIFENERQLSSLKHQLDNLALIPKNPNQQRIDELERQRLERATASNPTSENSPEVQAIDSELTENKKDLDSYRKDLDDIKQHIKNNTGNLQASDRDDPLARTKALWSLLLKGDNFLAWVTFGALLILFMVIDTFPIITKLSFRSIADDLVEQIEASDLERFQEMLLRLRLSGKMGIDEEVAREIMAAAKHTTEIVVSMAVAVNQELKNIDSIDGDDMKEDAKNVIRQTYKRAIDQIMDNTKNEPMEDNNSTDIPF